MNQSAYFTGMSHTDWLWLLLPINMLIYQLADPFIFLFIYAQAYFRANIYRKKKPKIKHRNN